MFKCILFVTLTIFTAKCSPTAHLKKKMKKGKSCAKSKLEKSSKLKVDYALFFLNFKHFFIETRINEKEVEGPPKSFNILFIMFLVISLPCSTHLLTFCTLAPARCRLSYVTSIVCDSSLYFSLLLLMFPCHTEHAARHWNSIVSWGKCLRLVFKSCVGWEHVDLNTFSRDMPWPLLSGVSLAEL